MEMVDFELYGIDNRPCGMASAFSDANYLKKRCRAFLDKIQKRIDAILTTDETLRSLLTDDICELKKEFQKINDKSNNDIEIFALFFLFASHLLGWAHKEGNFYRTPIYYQTAEQRERDLYCTGEYKTSKGLKDIYLKRQIVLHLIANGENYSSIASALNTSVSSVKNLEQLAYIDEMFKEGTR